MAKPHFHVTLACVDTGNRVDLASRAIRETLKLADFESVKLLTDDLNQPFAIQIPKLQGVAGYSEFVIRELHKYIDTSHVLLIQWDGYVLNPLAWQSRFLGFDWVSPACGNWVGIGGFSLRSKKLLQVAAQLHANERPHPEDSWLTIKHRKELEQKYGMKFCPVEVANGFAQESRAYNAKANVWSGTPTPWGGQFGFHSYLTRLPHSDRPRIFHHSGDLGDIIYALPTIAGLGGGMLYISPQVTPMRVRVAPTQVSIDSLATLLDYQPAIWSTVYTESRPWSMDYDLNQFRRAWTEHRAIRDESIVQMVAHTFGVECDGSQPWLTVPKIDPINRIIVSRSDRYHSEPFPWFKLVAEHKDRMLFVGLPTEHEKFCCMFGQVEYRKTGTILELAQVIQAGRCFIGNQSAPMALALGMGQNVIQEVWPVNPNCRLPRDNAIYCELNNAEIPATWLS